MKGLHKHPPADPSREWGDSVPPVSDGREHQKKSFLERKAGPILGQEYRRGGNPQPAFKTKSVSV